MSHQDESAIERIEHDQTAPVEHLYWVDPGSSTGGAWLRLHLVDIATLVTLAGADGSASFAGHDLHAALVRARRNAFADVPTWSGRDVVARVGLLIEALAQRGWLSTATSTSNQPVRYYASSRLLNLAREHKVTSPSDQVT